MYIRSLLFSSVRMCEDAKMVSSSSGYPLSVEPISPCDVRHDVTTELGNISHVEPRVSCRRLCFSLVEMRKSPSHCPANGGDLSSHNGASSSESRPSTKRKS